MDSMASMRVARFVLSPPVLVALMVVRFQSVTTSARLSESAPISSAATVNETFRYLRGMGMVLVRLWFLRFPLVARTQRVLSVRTPLGVFCGSRKTRLVGECKLLWYCFDEIL